MDVPGMYEPFHNRRDIRPSRGSKPSAGNGRAKAYNGCFETVHKNKNACHDSLKDAPIFF